MPTTLAEKRTLLLSTRAPGQATSTFQGFKAPTSNTTYTPNQFFDVVIPNFSRGVVRIVAYLLRKTLGWCDANGNPQEEQIVVSYSELENKAGVSRDMIRSALDDALAGHLLECVTAGRPKLAHDAGQSACYQLCWSSHPYTTRLPEFTGFFEGEGNRTDIPNEFFDVIIPNEPLSVIKVVGSVIRHSIGFQTRHGRRRQQVALSYQQIENYARFGSRSDLAKAVRIALEKNYIVRVEDGMFSPDATERRSATYAIRWCDFPIGQKNAPAVDQSENQTSIGQISAPAHQSENHTNIKTKPENETVNKPTAADTELHQKLVNLGFSEKTASKLISEHSQQTIEEQIAWLPHRAPARSPAGLLRRAIEQAWPSPGKLRATEVLGTDGWEFARCFYAAYGGNRGEPVNEPSPREAQTAEAFVQRLVRACGGECTPGEWGRALGQMAREQKNPFPSLQLAIRQFGDAYLVQIEKQRLHSQLATITQRREQHELNHRAAWLIWLSEQEAEMQRSTPDDYVRFTAKREHDRAELAADPKPWARKVLDQFATESAHLSAFREFFGLPGFWQWDASINSQSFQTNA
jgi:hypothetical protein